MLITSGVHSSHMTWTQDRLRLDKIGIDLQLDLISSSNTNTNKTTAMVVAIMKLTLSTVVL